MTRMRVHTQRDIIMSLLLSFSLSLSLYLPISANQKQDPKNSVSASCKTDSMYNIFSKNYTELWSWTSIQHRQDEPGLLHISVGLQVIQQQQFETYSATNRQMNSTYSSLDPQLPIGCIARWDCKKLYTSWSRPPNATGVCLWQALPERPWSALRVTPPSHQLPPGLTNKDSRRGGYSPLVPPYKGEAWRVQSWILFHLIKTIKDSCSTWNETSIAQLETIKRNMMSTSWLSFIRRISTWDGKVFFREHWFSAVGNL